MKSNLGRGIFSLQNSLHQYGKLENKFWPNKKMIENVQIHPANHNKVHNNNQFNVLGGEAPVLNNVEYCLIAIIPKSTLILIGSTIYVSISGSNRTD